MERTVTFTMEDALISPAGFMILCGAGLIEADASQPIQVHQTEQTAETKVVYKYLVTSDSAPVAGKTYWVMSKKDVQIGASCVGLYEGNLTLEPDEYFLTADTVAITSKDYYEVLKFTGTSFVSDTIYTEKTGDKLIVTLSNIPYAGDNGEDYIYVMPLKNGEVYTEPYIGSVVLDGSSNPTNQIQIVFGNIQKQGTSPNYTYTSTGDDYLDAFVDGGIVLVDYYVEKTGGVSQIDITPDKFGGNYYLEASTLFRDTNGTDLPAEFIIPNCKIQSNFTFTMASSGDPSELMRLAA